MRVGIRDRRALGGGVLRVQDDRLGTLVDEVLDLLVLQGGVAAVGIAADQLADELDAHQVIVPQLGTTYADQNAVLL